MYKFIENSSSHPTYILSIANHCSLMEALKAFCGEKNILSGEIRGLGAVGQATLRYYSPITKKYEDHSFDEQMEAASITGNISRKDGEVYLHVHAVFSRSDCSCIGGHLLDATISGACELFIEDLGLSAGRFLDDETGLNLYTFE